MLTLTVAFLEGVNIGLLVPILETMASPGQVGEHWLSQTVARIFDTVGVPLSLGPNLLALGVLILVTAGLDYVRRLMVAGAERDFTIWMRSKYMGDLMHADISYFHQERLGVLTGNLTLQAEHAGFCLRYIAEIIGLSGVILAYVAAAFVIAPVPTGVAVGIMILITLAVQVYIRRIGIIYAESVVLANDLQANAVETLSGIHVIKSFVMETIRWNDFKAKAVDMGNIVYRRERNRSQLLVSQEVARIVLIGIIVYLAAAVLSMDIAVIVALLFLLFRMAPRISGLNTARHNLTGRLSALHATQEIMAETTAPKIVSGDQPFTKLKTGIEMNIDSFSYNGSGEVLQNTRFTIDSGKTTAIVGASGAGKTTLVDLILRLYDPDQGSILVDGVDLRDLKLDDWRGSIGVVSQDVFLFNDTVANNIGLGRAQGTMDRIVDVAKQASAHEFIKQLPDGYETQIGDRGWNLSGGQRQRVAMARAILANPEILVLDEATSALDSESEQLIQQSMEQLRGACTVVVVAHRTSTIQNADKIVVLRDGKIVEEGDWNSLLAGAGPLANYHRLQSGNE